MQANFLGHEVDIAVRLVSPRQGSLVAGRIARYPIGLVASPDYLERHGMPKEDLESLSGYSMIGPDRDPHDLGIAARLGPNFAPPIGLAFEPTATRPSLPPPAPESELLFAPRHSR